jgi:hypothetical protein
MTDGWVCIDCGARQGNQGQCGECGHDDTLDLRDEQVRVLMRDVEQRLASQRDGRLRLVGVLVGMAAIIALWFVPGYWTARNAFGLPLMLDQLIMMALVGFGVMKLLGKLARPRFPYLRDDLTIG